MDAQRATFVEGCARHNAIPEAKANELFDLIDKFAGYGFNKSHAAAYALLTYQTAWLKAHHRAEFYAASMSFDIALTDKLSMFVEDMRRGGIDPLPPDINASGASFTVEEGAVVTRSARSRASARRRWKRWSRTGRGQGRSPASRNSPPGSTRASSTAASWKASPRLERSTGSSRSGPRCSPAPRRSLLTRRRRRSSAKRVRQACSEVRSAEAAPIRLPRDASWTVAQRMAAEREAFGFYFSAHPVDVARHLLVAHKVKTFAELADVRIAEGERVAATMAALVEDTRWRTSARGRRYMMATL